MTWQVRYARVEDFESISDIVNHYITHTVINFREHPQTAGDWLAGWEPHRNQHPWLVAERNGVVDGIAYATPWNERTAYRWTVEVTGYVRSGVHGRGIGSQLYGELLGLLDQQGYRSAIAVIALPNPASVRLHESHGFAYVGTFGQVGYKFGAWHDVGLWQRLIHGESEPQRVLSLAELDELEGERHT